MKFNFILFIHMHFRGKGRVCYSVFISAKWELHVNICVYFVIVTGTLYKGARVELS